MKKIYLIGFLFFICNLSFSQTQKLEVNGHDFLIRASQIENEWGTIDTVKELYRIEEEEEVYLFQYFEFKDRGGDCNNLFWNKSKLEIQEDSLVITTHYFQKTGIDPIAEWRKQIYIVEDNGDVNSVYDKFRYYDSEEWVDE